MIIILTIVRSHPVPRELATTPIRKRASAIYSVRMYNTLCVKSRSFVRRGCVCAALAFPRCQGCLEIEMEKVFKETSNYKEMFYFVQDIKVILGLKYVDQRLKNKENNCKG